MYTALYYPHTKLRKPEFTKAALLLWDKVNYISPSREYTPYYEDPILAEAAELLTVQHVPSEDEKRRAHAEIARLVGAELPEWFVFNPENPNLNYEIMAEKLLPETWEMLLESKFVQQSQNLSPQINAYDYMMSTSLGLTIMSILANVCAGQEKPTITDESDNYAALTRYFTVLGKGTYGNIELARDITPEAERLVTISVNTLSGQHAALHDIVELRKREEKARDPFLRELRRKYFDEVNKYIARLQSVTKKSDTADVEQEFERAMKDDLDNLRRELRLESWKLLFSKEMLMAVALAVGVVVEPIITTTIGTALLGKALFDHRENKRAKYKGHAMSWLYRTHPSLIHG